MNTMLPCLQAYAKPPALVELTLCGVMTVLKVPATWEDSKKQLGDASFMERLLKFDKDALDDLLLRKIAKFTQNPDFTPEVCSLSDLISMVPARCCITSVRLISELHQQDPLSCLAHQARLLQQGNEPLLQLGCIERLLKPD